jgi:oxygen-dependent protoporphyrinogen oxidase
MTTGRIAIVGTGIAACACAVALKEKDIAFTMFEKGAVPGGKLSTEQVDGFTVEAGPDSFLPEKFWTVDLIRRVGLEKELLATNEEHKGTFIYSRGRLHRLPDGVMLMVPTMFMPLARSGLISLPGKLRMGAEVFVPVRRSGADESLGRFVTRRLGKECLEKIAEPLVAGIHTSNPDNMSVKAIFPRFIDMEQQHGSLILGMVKAMKSARQGAPSANGRMTYFMSLKGGMQELTDACVRFIGSENIRTATEVREIRKTETGFAVTASTETLPFDRVIVAAPAFVTAGLVRGMAPDLAERLSAIEWSSTATISLAFTASEVGQELPGFGFIVPRIENRRINAATWSSIKWSFRAPEGRLLIRCFVGGGHHEELVDYDDDRLEAIVLEELRGIVGISAKPLFTKIYRWPRSMPRYTVGHLDRVAAIDAALGACPGLFLTGCSYKGIGIGDCVKNGFETADAATASIHAG